MKKQINRNNFMWDLIKYKPFLYMLTIVFNLLIGFIPLIEGMIIKEFFDVISGNKTTIFSPYLLIIMMAFVALIHILLMRTYYVKNSFHNFYISTLLRRNMLNSILKRHGANAIDKSVGQIINSFRDDVSQIETSIYWFSTLIGQIMRAVGAIVILLSIDVKMTLVVFIPLIIIIRLAQKSEKNIEENREEGRKATSEVNGTVGEIFESILSIKVFGAKRDLMNNLKTLNNKRNKAMLKDSMISQLIDSIYNNVINIGTGVILLLGAGAISKGRFTVGDFSIFVYYLAFISDSVESFGNFIVYFKQTRVGHRNILNKINIENSPEDLVKYKNIYLDKCPKEKSYKEDYSKQLISQNILKTLEVNGLSYLYKQSENGIRDISFTLKKGEILLICGRTGSGKTTLLKSIIGLLPEVAGEIYWNSKRIENAKDFFIPPISAYTSQVPNLFSDTVKNNILLGLSKEDVDLDGAIQSSVLDKDINEFDAGLDTLVGTKGAKLSGGQIQRLAAARMFVRKPQLYIFDDISSALDVETEKILWERLLSNDVSCIIVSNRRTILEKANNIVVLKDGIIESQGVFNELLKNSIEFKEILS